MQHMVNKLSFDFRCSNEEQAYVLRKKFIENNYADIVSVINAECDHLSNTDEFLKINKVEVHLSVREEMIYNPQEYLDALQIELRRELQKRQHSPVEKKSLQESRRGILTYFIENGYMPWWASLEYGDITSICHEIIELNELSGIIHFLLQHKRKKHIWERVAFQLSDEFKRSLVSEIILFKEIKEELKRLLQQQNLNKNVRPQSIESYEEQLDNYILKNGSHIFMKTGNNNDTISTREIRRLLDHFIQLIEPAGQAGLIPAKKETVADQLDSLTDISPSDAKIRAMDQPDLLTDISHTYLEVQTMNQSNSLTGTSHSDPEVQSMSQSDLLKGTHTE